MRRCAVCHVKLDRGYHGEVCEDCVDQESRRRQDEEDEITREREWDMWVESRQASMPIGEWYG